MSYHDVDGKRVHASPEALLALVEALGAPVSFAAGLGPGNGVEEALAERRRQLAERVIEPVVLAWDGRLASLLVQVPAAQAEASLSATLVLEDGHEETFPLDLARGGAVVHEELAGLDRVLRRVPVGRRLPHGYHRLSVQGAGARSDALLIAAPRRAYVGSLTGDGATADARPNARLWGVFAPLYAIHSEQSQDLGGIGNFTDLGDFLRWVGGLGGEIVATLPLLPTFLDDPVFEPSPYSPVSRRLWNEVFIDVSRLPELESSAAAQAALAEARGVLAGRPSPSRLVDWRAVARAKRSVLEAAAQSLYEAPAGPRRHGLEAFVDGHRLLEDYAAFRAAGEHFARPWDAWPSAAREGRLDGRSAPQAARRYHRYVQWVAATQIEAAAGNAGPGLLFDLPLGVHPAGFDVWRERSAFVHGASTGAPPDELNKQGQDWGNPPLHPQRERESGYAFTIGSVRHLLAYSGVLRVDHVMGLHRIFALPKAAGPGHGAYLRHRAEEGYAILALESYRARGGQGAMVLGEDLGTVPGYIRREMTAHGVQRCYVAEFGIESDPRASASDPARALIPMPPDAFASINTHDLAPFAAFWRGTDIDLREQLGQIPPERAASDRERRAGERARVVAALAAEALIADRLARSPDLLAPEVEEAVLAGWLDWMARSPARAVLVTLEDLWGETEFQNVPGTVDQHPNWRRQAPYSLEEIRCLPSVVGRLSSVDAQRRDGARESRS